MRVSPNALRWNGGTGHYEIYYVTLTDRDSGRAHFDYAQRTRVPGVDLVTT